MKQRIVFFASIAISAFILVVGAGVVTSLAYTQGAGVTTSQANNQGSGTEVSPQLQQQIVEREAAYKDLIDQANQRIQSLTDQLNALKPGGTTTVSNPAITAGTASEIALKAAGTDQAILKTPELVSYQGKAAFEVKLKDGVIYVDSTNGNVLFNGVPQRINEKQAAEIVGKFLGGMNPKYSIVKKVMFNNTEVYKVVFNVYTVYIDQFGKVLKAQKYEYTSTGGGGGGSSSSSGGGGGGGGEHEDGGGGEGDD